MRKINNYSLYLVISEEYGMGRDALEIARHAIAGGTDILQMREKNRSVQDLVGLGKDIAALCRQEDRMFIVNDNPMLAKRVDADGVHLGQGDMTRFTIKMARDAIGPDRVIGVSTHSLDQFKKANEEEVDYIAFGPIFPTKTKSYNIGTGDIEEVVRTTKNPVFFIGGINLSNIDDVLGRGARNIALIRGIVEADDIAARAKQFKEKLKKHKDSTR